MINLPQGVELYEVGGQYVFPVYEPSNLYLTTKRVTILMFLLGKPSKKECLLNGGVFPLEDSPHVVDACGHQFHAVYHTMNDDLQAKIYSVLDGDLWT